MKALIVEDVPQFAEVLERLIHTHFPDITIVGSLYHQEEVIAALQKEKPDILIMDIMLNEGTSFDILKTYQENYGKLEAELIFITAHPTYNFTQKALDHSALSFLKKPVDTNEFIQAMQRLMEITRNKKIAQDLGKILDDDRLNHLLEILESKEKEVQYLTIHLANGILKKISISDICYLEADGSMCSFFLQNGECIKAFRGLIAYKKMLVDDHGFFAIHGSYLINIKHLVSYKHKTREVQMSNDQTLIASKRQGQLLRNYLDGHLNNDTKSNVSNRLKSMFGLKNGAA